IPGVSITPITHVPHTPTAFTAHSAAAPPSGRISSRNLSHSATRSPSVHPLENGNKDFFAAPPPCELHEREGFETSEAGHRLGTQPPERRGASAAEKQSPRLDGGRLPPPRPRRSRNAERHRRESRARAQAPLVEDRR